MGKNQAYKAMQRSRVGSSSAAPDEVEDGMNGMLLVWQVSRHLIQLHGRSTKRSRRLFLKQYANKLEEEMRKGELEADKDRMMREYRAQLDAERARKLSQGKNHSSGGKSSRRKDKDRDSKKRSSKKRKHSKRFSDTSSSSSSESSSSDDEERESRRSRSRVKRRKKEKKSRTKSKHSSSENEEADGPLPLSRFFGNSKR